MTVSRWFNPLPATHPCVTDEAVRCMLCDGRFEPGDIVGLTVTPSLEQLMEGDRTVTASPVHRMCVVRGWYEQLPLVRKASMLGYKRTDYSWDGLDDIDHELIARRWDIEHGVV